ncbi:MAG: hypothetical protein ACE3JK_15085 [Sporolactobacillus sp.]
MKELKLSSIDAAEEMNNWYKAIQDYDLQKSRLLQNKIKTILQNMEENQNVLLYYSLLDFRAQLMTEKSDETAAEKLSELEQSKQYLNGVLSYYYSFFKGMYHFKNHRYASAISSYKMAEEKVDQLNDEVEKAECYYKLSQVYYEMQYNDLSIAYAQMALHLYQKYPDYMRNVFFLKIILAGNYLDQFHYREELCTLKEAIQLSNKIKDKRLIAIANLNMGIGYNQESFYKKAEFYIKKACLQFHTLKDQYFSKALLNLMETYVKSGLYSQAELVYRKGIKEASKWDDQEFITKFNLIKELLPSFGNRKMINHLFEILIKLNLYPDAENYSVEFARRFKEIGKLELATEYYEFNLSVKKMKKEGISYET